MKYKFECGCEFDVANCNIKANDDLPSMYIDYDNINYDCPATWNLISNGKTKGIFQLETQLGKTWAEQVSPQNINDIASLIAILRPGVLRALIDGKSMAQHYVDRKHNREEVLYFHQALEPILKDTYGVLLFQEESIRIATDIAGFNLQEADSLRKSLGKKLPELMAKIKIDFINGCKKQNIVNEQEAEQIFGWIQEGQKYLFNLCLSPSTVVNTPQGLKTIDELNIGDEVLAPKDNEEEDEYVKVLDKYENGEQELYKITLESGKKIECTLNHKFLCDDGKMHPMWKILKENMRIMCEND